MKKLSLFCLLVFSLTALQAQRVYFIYLQTDPAQPFYLRMDDKLYSSTASGYLILPKIKDSTYNFKIGFPGKDVDASFSVTVNKKDHGFLIKSFGDKGWGLFDLQTLGIQMSSSGKGGGTAMMSSDGEVDAFTELLSKAANDPSIKQTPIFAKAEEKKIEVQPAVVKETVVINPPVTTPPKIEEKKSETETPKDILTGNRSDDTNQQTVVKVEDKLKEKEKVEVKEEKKQEVAYKKSQVVKLSGNRTSTGIEILYVDQYPDGKTDTVDIVIPVTETEAPKVAETKTEEKKEDKKFLDISSEAKAETKTGTETKTEAKKEDSVKSKPIVTTPVAVTQPKGKCKATAVEDDFLKLRRKMSAKTNDDGRIDEAKKYFKVKCFSTEYIRNLSSMFISDAAKYHFFDAAYEHISDEENFSSLASLLKDDYYIGRFKAMLHN